MRRAVASAGFKGFGSGESLLNCGVFWGVFNCERFLNGTISSVVEQHLFSVNPTRGQCSGDCQLTPRPPTPGVSTSARQRRRQRREQQEELLRRRYDERSTVTVSLLGDGTSMQLLEKHTTDLVTAT